MSRDRLRAAVTATLVLASAPGAARANGRFPQAGQIAAGRAQLVVRATYGLLSSGDAGASWTWSCEAAVGFQGLEDPMVAVADNGAVLVALAHGLAMSRDGGCQWDAVAPFSAHAVVDIAVDAADPTRVVAMTSEVSADDRYHTQTWLSADDGATWTRAGDELATDFVPATIDFASGAPDRIYASGVSTDPAAPGRLLRSDDRGATWRSFAIPGSDASRRPYIGAVDPVRADTLYVRTDGPDEDALLVSRDGGETWRELLRGPSLLGLAVSPDGARVAVGGPEIGVWTADRETLAFVARSPLAVRCLAWTADGLLACADQRTAGFTIGRSVDQGATFTPLMQVDALCPTPVRCDAATTSGAACPAAWPDVAPSLGVPPACYGAGSDDPPPQAPVDTGGCAASPDRSASAPLAFIAAALLARRRRR